MWCACVFRVDRAYGGPEEGGWWYDCGEPQPTFGQGLDARFFPTRGEAVLWVKSGDVKDRLSTANAGRTPISSVNSDGMYEMQITFGMPKPYPATVPHYE